MSCLLNQICFCTRLFVCLENGQVFSCTETAAKFFNTTCEEIDKALMAANLDYDYAVDDRWHFQYLEDYEGVEGFDISLSQALSTVD